jgi:hypothetical protein
MDCQRSFKMNLKIKGSKGELSLTLIGTMSSSQSRGICLRKKQRRGSLMNELRLLEAKVVLGGNRSRLLRKVKVEPLEDITIQQRV